MLINQSWLLTKILPISSNKSGWQSTTQGQTDRQGLPSHLFKQQPGKDLRLPSAVWFRLVISTVKVIRVNWILFAIPVVTFSITLKPLLLLLLLLLLFLFVGAVSGFLFSFHLSQISCCCCCCCCRCCCCCCCYCCWWAWAFLYCILSFSLIILSFFLSFILHHI